MRGFLTGILLFATTTLTAAPAQWCCRVVGMNAQTGVGLARNDANGKTFLFTAHRGLFANLKAGTRVSFDRRAGLSVQGFPNGSFKPMRGTGRGAKPDAKVEIDCTISPQLCPGYKPGQDKLTKIGTTTWEDVMDYCWDEMFSGQCISGPMG
ncbi:MAG: hypothetical protein M3041_06860 [Acidobacteriota bacterium]|nr:hypothetical protein [Acidobacteriota bacterium]